MFCRWACTKIEPRRIALFSGPKPGPLGAQQLPTDGNNRHLKERHDEWREYDPIYYLTVLPESQPAWKSVRQSHAFRYVRCHNALSDGLPDRPRHVLGNAKRQTALQLAPSGSRARHLGQRGTETDFMPDALAAGPIVRNYGGGAVNTPKDYKKWRNLIRALAKHCIARQARLSFERAGVSDCIELRLGDAQKVIPQLSGEFDLVFLDVDKRLYAPLLADCVWLLRPGGILVAEDTLFPAIELEPKWHHLIAPIEEFNRLIVNQPEVASTILPIGDDATVAAKKLNSRA